jgi:cytochrome P450
LGRRKGTFHVPKGTALVAHYIHANRDQNFWGKRGQEYIPAKFLNMPQPHMKGLIVTGGGPDILSPTVSDRRCPCQWLGKEFVKEVLLVALHTWVWEFEVPDADWDYNTWNAGWHPFSSSMRLKTFTRGGEWV